MKKMVVIVVLLCVLAAGLYTGSGFILGKISKEIISYVMIHGKDFGLDIQEMNFSFASISSFNSVTWLNFRMKFNLLKNGEPDPDRACVLQVDRVTLAVELSQKTLVVTGKALLIVSGQNAFGSPESLKDSNAGKIWGNSFKIYIKLDDFSLQSIARQVDKTARGLLSKILKENAIDTQIEFTGRINFYVDGRLYDLGLYVVEENDVYSLRLDKSDLKKIADFVPEKLNNAEINILHLHPVQAPQLLRIEESSRKTAFRAHDQNPDIPRDAYRHVLWTYLLTNEFGEKLAKEVGDAHETDDLYNNVDAEHQMDYHNNAIGIEYAKAGFTEDTILTRVLADARVVRSIDQLSSS